MQKLVVALSLLFTLTCSYAQWRYSTKQDKMRETTTKYAELNSKNSVQLKFPYGGGSTLRLILRGEPEKWQEAYFWLSKGQLPCIGDYCGVSVKFDKDEVTFFKAGGSTGPSNALFLKDADNFIRRLKEAKNVTVEVEIYDYGDQQFQFSVQNLKWQ